MKPAAAPKLPEGTPWEKLDMAFRKALTVSKEALLKEEAKAKRAQERKKKRTKRHA